VLVLVLVLVLVIVRPCRQRFPFGG